MREKLERDALLPPEAVSSFDHGCLLHPSLFPVTSAHSFQLFSFLSGFFSQMAKSKRKPTSVVQRSHVPAPPPTTVLGIKSVFDRLDGSTSTSADLSPLPVVNSSSGVGTNGSLYGSLEVDHSNNEDLDEEQLDFSCFEEEYATSPPPASPAKPSGVDPPKTEAIGKPHSPSSTNGRWRDLFSSNRNTSICSKLMHFSHYNAIPSCPFLEEDLDHSSDDWKLCVVGYVSGKFPRYRALHSIIGNT